MNKCDECVRKEHCDLYIEDKENANKDGGCLCKTVRMPDGKLDNNTRRYLEHEELL